MSNRPLSDEQICSSTTLDPLRWIHQHTDPLAFHVRPILQGDDLFDVWTLTADGILERYFAAEEISNLPSLLGDLTTDNKVCFATVHISDEALAQSLRNCFLAFKNGGQS